MATTTMSGIDPDNRSKPRDRASDVRSILSGARCALRLVIQVTDSGYNQLGGGTRSCESSANTAWSAVQTAVTWA